MLTQSPTQQPSLTNAYLRTLPPAQLVRTFQQTKQSLVAPNYTPRRLRANSDAASQARARRAANALGRIRHIARERGLDLNETEIDAAIHAAHVHPVGTSDERDPRDIQRGDRVNATYRDITSLDREIVTREGTVERVENGRVGLVFHVRFDEGDILPLDKSCLTRI